MNVELLRRVQEAIREEPKRIDMWIVADENSEWNAPPCGTVGCIYGWGEALSTGLRSRALADAIPKGFAEYLVAAAKLFEIDYIEAELLCQPDSWPDDLLEDLEAFDPGTPGYAAIVCERIDRFIATEGAE